MSVKRWPSRNDIAAAAHRRSRGIFPLLLLMLLAAIVVTISLVLRSLTTALAVSTAEDTVVTAINDVIQTRMSAANDEFGALVHLEKDETGAVCALTTDVVAINKLSSDLLLDIVAATQDHELEVRIPLGTLTGSALLLSRGPDVRIRVQVLSSSFTGFRSTLNSIGINQTRHQILLELREELTLLMPWRTISTTVITEIPVSDTIIVGQVPQSYLNMGE